MKKSSSGISAKTGGAPSGDWRSDMLQRIRAIIAAAVPDAVETRKWKKPTNPAGVPVWEKDGILCTGETYKDKVKLTFANGAALEDPAGLFNSSLDGNQRRAIDIAEGDAVNAAALKALLRAAAAFNASKPARPSTAKKRAVSRSRP
ncbi:MAG: DUF1801 domain-containing protein [Parvularculaceae bacterium]